MGNGALAIGLKLPRSSSTLPKPKRRDVCHLVASRQNQAFHGGYAREAINSHFLFNVMREKGVGSPHRRRFCGVEVVQVS